MAGHDDAIGTPGTPFAADKESNTNERQATPLLSPISNSGHTLQVRLGQHSPFALVAIRSRALSLSVRGTTFSIHHSTHSSSPRDDIHPKLGRQCTKIFSPDTIIIPVPRRCACVCLIGRAFSTVAVVVNGGGGLAD